MALFGREKARPFDDLHRIVIEIYSATRRLDIYWARLGNKKPPSMNEKTRERLIKDIEEYEKVIWWANYPDPDPIEAKVKKVIEEIEKICEPILRK